MDAQFIRLLSRFERNPENDLLWQQVKKYIKEDPGTCCCHLFFDQVKPGNSMDALIQKRGIEIFREIMTFYQILLDKTQFYGDIWGGGQDFWHIHQFLEAWSADVRNKLPPSKVKLLDKVLQQLRSLASTREIYRELNELKLPFLPHEVAWNLAMYLTPASKLADYPQFTHMYFLPSELIPLAMDLENYNLSPFNERYLETLLHDTRKQAIKNNLLYFAQTFPLVLQAKWAYAIYLSLDQCEWSKHPFIRRLLANSYWDAKLRGEIMVNNSNKPNSATNTLDK